MFLIQHQTPFSSDRAQTQLRDQNRLEQRISKIKTVWSGVSKTKTARLPAGFVAQRGRPLAFQIMQLSSEFQIQIEDKTCQFGKR